MKKKRNYMHKSNWWKYLLAVVIVIFHVLPLYVLVVMAFKTKTDMSSLLIRTISLKFLRKARF